MLNWFWVLALSEICIIGSLYIKQISTYLSSTFPDWFHSGGVLVLAIFVLPFCLISGFIILFPKIRGMLFSSEIAIIKTTLPVLINYLYLLWATYMLYGLSQATDL